MAVYTTLEKINIAKVSQYLAGNTISKSGLFGGGKDLKLQRKLYCIRKSIEDVYNLDTSEENLFRTSTYLLGLCAPYSLEAVRIVTGGSGGSVSPVVPDNPIYPFIINSSDFEADGVSYNDSNIVGDRLMIFINQWSQQWFGDSDSAFTYTATGIEITLPGFNANTASYTIVIQRDYTS